MLEMKVVLLQRQPGTASFVVMSGSLYARQVSVRYLDREYYEKRWADGMFPHYTREQFETNVLDEIGIVHNGFEEVPPDVVRAVWEELAIERALTPERFAKYFTTGTYHQGQGWELSNVRAFPAPTSFGQPVDDVEPSMIPPIRIESLSQRPVH